MKTHRLICRAVLFGMMCLVAPEPAQARNGKHLFILSGQSNMRQPLPDSFRQVASKVFGEDRVIVVTHAHPGQPIRQWYKKWTPPKGVEPDDKENGKLYEALLARVKKAIAGQSLATVTFVWMQGEADAGSGWGAVYEQSFLGVLEQFRQDLERDRINFVLGRISDHYLTVKGIQDGDTVRAAQVKLGEDHAHGDWINTDDLNSGVNPWGIYEIDGGHFPNSAYRVLGRRFARKACHLIDPKIALDLALFHARHMAAANDMKTHAAIGKAVTGTAADPDHKGAAKLAALTDGRFGGTDPGDGRWVGIAPGTENAQWIVDLGEVREIGAVAADILINKDVSAGFPVGLGFAASTDGAEYRPMFHRGKQTAIKFGYRDRFRLQWNAELKPRSVLVFLDQPTKSRYIKVTANTAESWLFIDEIAVNPVAK